MSSVPSNSSKSPLACAVPIHCNQPSLAATFSNTTRFSPALKLCTLAKSTSQRTGHIFDTVLPSAPRLDGGGGGAAAAAAAAAAPEVGGIDGDGSLSDDAGLLMMEQGQMVPGNNPHLREIQRPEKFELDRVRGLVASSSRSTIILVTNRTAVPLRLTSQALAAGSWLDKHAPPMEIPPFTQVFFANVTSSASLVSHTEPPN
jgi:hypothetical protein